MIVYFSGTGNSRWCAELLADRLDDEILDVFHYIRNGIAADLISGKPWVFVCPTYAWRLPRIFREFIRSGSFMGSEEAYFIMTCGDSIGNAAQTNGALCAEKGLHHRGTLEVPMPENYIALFDVPTAAECHTLVRNARPLLERAAREIAAQQELTVRPIRLVDHLKSGPVNPLFYRLIVKDRKFRVGESCISCGKCAEHCPTGNIELRDGKPVWQGNCTHCMACICGCPVSAIEYGRASLGKVRYQGPVYDGRG